QLRVTQQTLTSREDAWRLAKRQFETGYTSRLELASSVAVGYVTLLSLDEQLRVTQQTLTSREDAWRLAKRQFETGYTSRLEL
ncbi:hypothetical protein CQA48_30285, partial [Klebsiella pneumoniae]